jgi:putative transposase
MPEYRRIWIEGGTFFFTLVTYQRRPFLTEPLSRELLHAAWENVNRRFPFTTQAICLLPDHLHCIWSLPENDRNYALRWGEIKKIFTKTWHKQIGKTWPDEFSRLKRGEGAIWQRRFWEHAIRDEQDYENHLNYIHYNPVKHRLVKSPKDWPWSSFHRYVQQGFYDRDWGADVAEEYRGINLGE